MKAIRQKFEVKYKIKYKSGKTWTDSQVVNAVTEYGAKEIIRWIFCKRDITILKTRALGQYVGFAIHPTHEVLGDF